MGLVVTIHELSPEVVRAVTAAVADRRSLATAELREILAAHRDVQPSEVDLDSWDDLDDWAEAERLNWLLVSSASRRSWDLDKAMDRPGGGLNRLLGSIPALEPVERALRAADLDAAGISSTFAAGGEGLRGVVAGDRLAQAAQAIVGFDDEGTRARVADLPVPWHRRLAGWGAFRAAWTGDDYLWRAWRKLVEAIETASKSSTWLGLQSG